MLTFHTLDVFTSRPYAGNPLAVVLGADDLGPAQMQTIAGEFNLSETIFVQKPRDPANTARVRIFTPRSEMPFAGHPTVGCAALLAILDAQAGDFTREIRLEEEAGLVPVQVTRKGHHTEAEFTAPVIPYSHPGRAPRDLAARAIGLEPDEIGLRQHTPGIWAGGPSFLYLPIRDRACLARARPVEPFWSELMEEANVLGGYAYTDGHGVDFQARMFAPTDGIPEDPATGSASAVLAAQLHAAGQVPPGTSRFTLLQGVEMGRPSEIALTIEADASALTRVRISGGAIRMSEGRIRVSEQAFAMP